MSQPLARLTTALSDRYRLERELRAGGMATELAAESRGSADVTEVTSRPGGSQSVCVLPPPPEHRRRFSDRSRAAALAASSSAGTQ